MILVVIILALIGITTVLSVFWAVLEPLFVQTIGCDIYCDIHRETAEYGYWAMWPSWLGGSVSWSEIIINSARASLSRPAAMGCYCGISERYGKYIHVKTTEKPEYIKEFHLTDQNPGIHLAYTATGFDHTGGLNECENIVDNEFDGFGGLEKYEACIIVSVRRVEEDEDNYECAIWTAEEGSVLINEEGKTTESMLVKSERYSYGLNRGDDVIASAEVLNEIGLSGGHASQRMLLQNVSEGDGKFKFAAPVVCKMDGREEEETDSDLDAACRNYCNDKGEIFWNSMCSDMPAENYDLLPEDYRNDEKLCPEIDPYIGQDIREMAEGDGNPYCQCKAEKEYYWEVDEEYDPDG